MGKKGQSALCARCTEAAGAREPEASCWGLALSACLAALQTRPGSAAWWLRGGPSSGAGWWVVNSAKLAKP